MRKRNIQIITRLDETENERFKKRVEKSGLTQEAYIRQLINGLIPNDAQPPDFFAMMTQIRRVGVTLNQIAKKAHTINMIDTERYDENVAFLKSAILEITNAVMLPRKMEKG
jgi:hypothetical protein